MANLLQKIRCETGATVVTITRRKKERMEEQKFELQLQLQSERTERIQGHDNRNVPTSTADRNVDILTSRQSVAAIF